MILRRRANPPKYADYRRYKPLLREDFRYCCGYCRIHESAFGSTRNMTIDHLQPKSRFPRLAAEYVNLHYCCGECNTYKGDHWPASAELAAGRRFVDACVEDPDDHYEYVDAEIRPRTPAGEFTVASLRLDRPGLRRRRSAVMIRFSEIVRLIERTERMGEAARAAGTADRSFEDDLAAIRADLIQQLRELTFPSPLAG